MSTHSKTFDAFGNKWCNFGHHYAPLLDFSPGKRIYQCRQCRRAKRRKKCDGLTEVSRPYIKRFEEDLATMNRMNRDTIVKLMTKKMTDKQLVNYIRVKVKEELQRDSVKRKLFKTQNT